MLSYETGVLLAFLLWLWSVISAIVSINSQMERNLNKIGQRLSWLTMTPKPVAPEEANRSWLKKVLKFLLLHGIGLPFILTSWLYVVYGVGMLLYRKSKDAGAPQAVREFRWKLRNTEMTFDQIVKEMMKASDQDPADFEKIKTEILQELEVRKYKEKDESDFWAYERKCEEIRLKFDPENKWDETTSIEYSKELHALNREYRKMLQRRNGWTEADFSEEL